MSSSSQHPNIVKYKGFVKSSTHLHIILECVVLSVTLFHSRRPLTDGHSGLSFLVGLLLGRYCENGSLHSICKRFGRFPEALVSQFIYQVASPLLLAAGTQCSDEFPLDSVNRLSKV
jgi:serine/threonine protein kinase